jgi:hypothetical protein
MSHLRTSLRIFLLFAALTVLVQLLVGTRSWAAASDTDLVLLDARALTTSEGERAQALVRLQKRPRLQLRQSLKDLLKEKESRQSSLAAISAMDMTEMLSDLRPLVEKEDDWHLFATTNHLLSLTKDTPTRDEFAKVYSTRLMTSVSSPAKMAFLDGLGELKMPLSGKVFQQLLSDQSDGVREAAIRQFLESRAKLSNAEQIKRFRDSFHAKPYQARLTAMVYFANLPSAEQSRFYAAIDKNLCKNETKKQVQPICQKILASAKNGEKSGDKSGVKQ